MSRSVSPTRVVLAVGAVACALALSGCGAGQITQTSTQVSGVDGASATVGRIGVRDAEFPFTGDGTSAAVYRAGGTAPLAMRVVNFGAESDKLMAASSPVASSVNITGDATVSAGKVLLVSGEPARPPVAASGSARAGASAGASATPSASPVPAAPTAAAVPTTTAVSTAEPAPAVGSTASAGAAPVTGPSPEGTTMAQVVLTGLKEDLKGGLTYPVVLRFQKAGDLTLQVPVGSPGEGSPAE